MHIYNGDIQDTTNHGSNSYLQVNSCGVNHYPAGFLTTRSRGRKDYHILYIRQGNCDVTYGGKCWTLQPGMFVLYPPQMPQRYEGKSAVQTIWLHFNGFAVESVLEECGLSCGVHTAMQREPTERMLLELVSEHHLHLRISEEKGILLTLLFRLGKAVCRNASSSDDIKNSIHDLTARYNEPLELDRLAQRCGLSKSRYAHLFRQITGMAPHSYQQLLRMNAAKTLLETTTLPVSEVSAAVGYQDPLYFSRLFKNHTGQSPLHYRRSCDRDET